MKLFIITTLFLAASVFACDERSNNTEESSIDCSKEMRAYANVVESYAGAIDTVNLQELADFRDWLNENTNTHIICSEDNRMNDFSIAYKDIFTSNYELIGSITGLIKSNDMLGKPDDFIASHVAQSYSVMRKAVARFNK